MKKIIGGASKPRKFKLGAAGIMWWEETDASHAYSVLFTENGKKMVFQAVGAGSEFVSYDYFISHNIPVYEKEFEVEDALYNTLFDTLVDKLKVKYSCLHLLGLFYKRAIQYGSGFLTKGKYIIVVKNPFRDEGKSAVCVEALCSVVDGAKIKRQAEDPEDMGMYEALKMLKSLPGKELQL